MTSEPSNPVADGQPTPGVRAQTLAWQGLANRIVRGLLRTPLLCRVVGNRLITVYVVGRKSGRHYIVPVAYTHHDGVVLDNAGLVAEDFNIGRSPLALEPDIDRLAGAKVASPREWRADQQDAVMVGVGDRNDVVPP